VYYKNKTEAVMIKKTLALLACLSCSSSVIAFEEISEEELSGTSAQDGITVFVGLPANGWRANEMSLTDKNGIDASLATGYANAGTIAAKNIGFNTCTSAVGCVASSTPSIRIDVDAVGDYNGAVAGVGGMLNIGFSLMGTASKVRLYIDGLWLRNGAAGATETKFLDFQQDYIDITPIGSLSLFSVQLGNESSGGHLLHFTNGNFGTIDFGVVALLDKQDNNNSLRFGLKLDNVDLTGSGFDFNANGLVYTASNFGGGVMNVTLSNIAMGNASAPSIGSIGVEGLSVSNLAVTIAGKL
jgi:hypothetical protein